MTYSAAGKEVETIWTWFKNGRKWMGCMYVSFGQGSSLLWTHTL